jgi:hypothetical protein
MHQDIDMSPATTVAGLFLSPPPDDWEGWDEWPYDWPDEPLEPLPEGLPSKPVPLVALLEGPNDVLLARHEFTEPLTVNNGDVLTVRYNITVDGEEMSFADVEARVVRADDIPAQ